MLASRHPEWSDETLFMQTRERLIALFQKITYEEYIPILIGRTFDMSSYNDSLDPTPSNLFSNGAWRIYGHSALAPTQKLVNEDWSVSADITQARANQHGSCFES